MSKTFMALFSRIGCALFFASALCAPSEARVRTLYHPADGVPAQFDALEAVRILGSRNGYSNVGWACSRVGFVAPSLLTATGSRFEITCADGTMTTYRYTETRGISVGQDSIFSGIYVYVLRGVAPTQLTLGFTEPDLPAAEQFADSWLHLGQVRPVSDPATDTQFQAALQAERATATDTESLRRTQAQVEALLHAGRTIEAARLYRDRLSTAPLWALGHYNLALVYGTLELYPEAINEMRRYLYLSPQASDARAAQDQIYQWEVLAPGGAR